jgi:excisionase family DNA binding protein
MTAVNILTVREVAERLEASRATITAWCRKGKFPNAKKIKSPAGDYWEIPESDLKSEPPRYK